MFILNPYNIVRKDRHSLIYEIDTRLTTSGSTASNQMTIPLGYESTGAGLTLNSNFEVDWGDGNVTFHVNKNDNPIHTYSVGGVYKLKITPPAGTYIAVSTESLVDKRKLVKLLQFGDRSMIDRNFLPNCPTISLLEVSDTPKIVFSLFQAIQNSSSITQIPNLGDWDVSNVTTMHGFSSGNSGFFQDISMWDFNINVVLTNFMSSKSNYPPAYYDALLINWASKFIGSGRSSTKTLGMGANKYTSAGATARAALVSDGWTITDGGLA